MTINSRQKGARGERMWRDQLRENGYEATRGQQFSGGNDSPDVKCPDLPRLHMEVKFVEALNLQKAVDQAKRDGGQGKDWIVAHKKKNTPWLVTMDSDLFFRLLRENVDLFQ